MAGREELVRRAQELTLIIREHQESVREAARERQQIVDTLYRQEQMTDAAIGELLGLTRQAIEAIRKGRGFGA